MSDRRRVGVLRDNFLRKSNMICFWMIFTLPIEILNAEQAPTSEPASLVTIPAELQQGLRAFFTSLNSNQLWKMGPLLRPDLSEEKATQIYLAANPNLAAQRESGKLPDPMDGGNMYVPRQLESYSDTVCIVSYGRLQSPREFATAESVLWVRIKNYWKLVGWGWDLKTAKTEALKYVTKSK